MKKIGILTFHNELNYGAIMQAYALQKYVSKNNDVQIINYDMNKKKSIKHRIISVIKKYKFKEFMRNNMKLTKLITDKKELKDIIETKDYIIVGSDQVWAFDLIEKDEDVYFLDYKLSNTKKVSYAASFGKDENIINNIDKVKKYLNSFDRISVREESSALILRDNNVDAVDVVDPTLLLSAEEYIKDLSVNKLSEKYILVYMLEITPEIIEVVNKIAQKLKVKIICFNNINRFGKNSKNMPNASPKDFVELFYNAEFVVTNSFHGTCFSLIFNKRFITLLHGSKGVRQVNILKKAGLENHIYDEKKDVDYYLNLDVKKDNSFEEYINESKLFLNSL